MASERGVSTRGLLLAGGGGMTIGLVTVLMALELVRSYGMALFVGAPLVIGVVTSFILNRRATTTRTQTNSVVLLTLTLTALSLLAAAMEGLVCIVMAIPIAIPLALLGGTIGRRIAEGPRQSSRPMLFAVLALPLWVALEPRGSTGQVTHEVRSSIEIAAPPLTVWPHVVAFEPLPAPEELMFRAGVAFPVRARIDGTGVGAVRYCEFSTGAFVEPITRWEPGVTLAFDVSASPPPLTEWSPYRNVHPPHLDGFLRARRGEFRLVPLEGGRTRLEGRTWYEIEMAPEAYWQTWTDYLIHRIHMRVLDQIKQESEGSAGHGSKIAGH